MNHKTIWVFAQRKEWGLRWSDLLVFSICANREKAGWGTKNTDIIRNTGLSENTVSASYARLHNAGLMKDGVTVWVPELWYCKETRRGDRWQGWVKYWNCLVKAPGSPLNIPATMVYSYLLDKAGVFQPDGGWKSPWLATALAMDRATVDNALKLLTEEGLANITEAGWEVLPHHLRSEHQNSFFVSKSCDAGPGVSLGFMSAPTFDPKVSDHNPPLKIVTASGENVDVPQLLKDRYTDEKLRELILAKCSLMGITDDVEQVVTLALPKLRESPTLKRLEGIITDVMKWDLLVKGF